MASHERTTVVPTITMRARLQGVWGSDHSYHEHNNTYHHLVLGVEPGLGVGEGEPEGGHAEPGHEGRHQQRRDQGRDEHQHHAAPVEMLCA